MDQHEIEKVYDELHAQAPGDLKGVGHRTPDTQADHYRQVSFALRYSFQSVLDVGCGYGGLYQYLNCPTPYTGVDTNPDAIAVAKARYPTKALDFYVKDFVADWEWFKAAVRPDIVAMVGTLSFYDPSDAMDLVAKGWELTTDAIVVTMHRDTNALLPGEIIDYFHPDYYLINHAFDKEVAAVHMYKEGR